MFYFYYFFIIFNFIHFNVIEKKFKEIISNKLVEVNIIKSGIILQDDLLYLMKLKAIPILAPNIKVFFSLIFNEISTNFLYRDCP